MKFTPLLLLSLFFATPLISLAYTVEDTKAIAIGDTHGLYSITFSFRFNDRPSFFPMQAVLGEHDYDTALSYRFVNNTDSSSHIEAQSALLLSASTPTDRFYQTPAETKGEYTLLAVLKVPEGSSVTDYSLEVASLPFYTQKSDRVSQHRLTGDNLDEFDTGVATYYGDTPAFSTSLFLLGEDAENVTITRKQ